MSPYLDAGVSIQLRLQFRAHGQILGGKETLAGVGAVPDRLRRPNHGRCFFPGSAHTLGHTVHESQSAAALDAAATVDKVRSPGGEPSVVSRTDGRLW